MACTVEPGRSGPGPVLRRLTSFGREAALVAVLLLAYREGRHLAAGHVAAAQRHAAALWHLERRLHLPSEADVQHLLLHSHVLVRLADRYYITVHFPLTAAFLVWLWWRHHDAYGRVRTTLALTTAAGLALTALLPLAPPRLLGGDGLEDTMQVIGPSAYNRNTTVGLANQYAAMPSLHVAWAVLIGVTVVAVSTRRRLRWLALAHPILTTVIVVGTANHYWADVLVGVVLLGLSAALVYHPPRWLRAAGARLRPPRRSRPAVG